jgi:hypothetical protein
MKRTSSPWDALFVLRVLFGLMLSSVGVFLALLALSVNSSSTALAARAQSNNEVTIINSYHNDVSPALRDVGPWPVQRVQEQEAAENPLIVTGHVDQPDTVVQKSTLLGRLAPSLPAQLLNFGGIPSTGWAPPDTNGEVGATQYVQMVNQSYQVFSKNTGTSVLGPNSIASLWSGFGGVCQTSGRGDPVVLYDQIANRWVISQFAGSSYPTDECVAVSTTSDATGTYNRYGFHVGSNLFDYPKISVWPDAYYMSANIFDPSGTTYLGPQAFAMDRTKMLAGQPATLIQMPILGGSPLPRMLPADLDGSTLPPAGAPNSFVLFPDTNTYRVYHFKVGSPFGTMPTFTLFGTSPAAAFTQLCPTTRVCVPALQGDKVDGLGDRLMFRLAYRNFTGVGAHESLVGNFTVNSSGHAGVRWFELRGVTAGPVTTFQQSTYSPDTTYRWMGSVAMDKDGNMALGYSASSATIHPQVRYTGRLSTDPLNTMPQGEGHIIDGAGSQLDTYNRWGDYSGMTVDPVDDQTFWYTQEYYNTVSSFNWVTRIANFRIAATTSQVVNFSDRALISSGNNVGNGGFVIQGGTSKSVGIRGLGPSTGLPGPLADPYLELHDGNGNLIASNDNWQDTQKQQIIDAGLAPGNNLESVIIATLAPGTYATVLRGKTFGTGIGNTEFYDLQSTSGQFVNASGRTFVGTGNNIAIGSFNSQGSGTRKYLIRGLGPSTGVPGYLVNPYLKIFDSNNNLLFENNNWGDTQMAQISATGLAPQDGNEAAILIVLPAGVYSIQLTGVGGGTGIGNLEIFVL